MIQAIQDHNFWISLVFASIAVVVNLRFALRHRTSIKRLHYFAVAGVAAFYAVSYGLHLSDVWGRLEWSENVLPASTISWLLVWISPVLLDERIRRAGIRPEDVMTEEDDL